MSNITDGSFTFPDGGKYTGPLQDGKPWGNGGTYTFSNGGTYSGEMLNGLPNGQGSWECPNGWNYVGGFVDGVLHGVIKCYYCQEMREETRLYENGKYVTNL